MAMLAWFTAGETGALAIFAAVAAWYARKAFKDQQDLSHTQTEVLKRQVGELDESREERKLDREQRKRAQAARVFIWEDRALDQAGTPAASGPAQEVAARLKNTSNQPIYDLVLCWYFGEKPQDSYSVDEPIMPGGEVSRVRPEPPPGRSSSRFGAVAFFRDANGVYWRAYSDGNFDELRRDEEYPQARKPNFQAILARHGRLPARPQQRKV